MANRRGDTAFRPGQIAVTALALIWTGLAACIAYSSEQDTGSEENDPRQVYSQGSPTWLRAVGKLQVPGRKIEAGRRSQYTEDCSASLIVDRASAAADTIVTAWPLPGVLQ